MSFYLVKYFINNPKLLKIILYYLHIYLCSFVYFVYLYCLFLFIFICLFCLFTFIYIFKFICLFCLYLFVYLYFLNLFICLCLFVCLVGCICFHLFRRTRALLIVLEFFPLPLSLSPAFLSFSSPNFFFHDKSPLTFNSNFSNSSKQFLSNICILKVYVETLK